MEQFAMKISNGNYEIHYDVDHIVFCFLQQWEITQPYQCSCLKNSFLKY